MGFGRRPTRGSTSELASQPQGPRLDLIPLGRDGRTRHIAARGLKMRDVAWLAVHTRSANSKFERRVLPGTLWPPPDRCRASKQHLATLRLQRTRSVKMMFAASMAARLLARQLRRLHRHNRAATRALELRKVSQAEIATVSPDRY